MFRNTRVAWAAFAVLSAAIVSVPRLFIGQPPTGENSVATVVDGAVEQRSADLESAPTAAVPVLKVSVSACGVRTHGTGFVVGDGLVMTAAHVVGDAGLVRLDLGSGVATGEVLGRLADGRDLALVAIDTGRIAAPQSAAPSSLGDAVTMVGYPGGSRRTVSVGPRTDPLPTTSRAVAGELIGVSAPTGEGFSGGPALDADGRLLGVVVAAEAGTGTSIVVALPDVEGLADAPLIPGVCSPAT